MKPAPLTNEPPATDPNRDLDGSLILNGASLLLTTVILLALRRFLHWAFPALVLHSYLPVALAGYIISLLLAYLALNLALRARRDPDFPITSRIALGCTDNRGSAPRCSPPEFCPFAHHRDQPRLAGTPCPGR